MKFQIQNWIEMVVITFKKNSIWVWIDFWNACKKNGDIWLNWRFIIIYSEIEEISLKLISWPEQFTITMKLDRMWQINHDKLI